MFYVTFFLSRLNNSQKVANITLKEKKKALTWFYNTTDFNFITYR